MAGALDILRSKRPTPRQAAPEAEDEPLPPKVSLPGSRGALAALRGSRGAPASSTRVMLPARTPVAEESLRVGPPEPKRAKAPDFLAQPDASTVPAEIRRTPTLTQSILGWLHAAKEQPIEAAKAGASYAVSSLLPETPREAAKRKGAYEDDLPGADWRPLSIAGRGLGEAAALGPGLSLLIGEAAKDVPAAMGPLRRPTDEGAELPETIERRAERAQARERLYQLGKGAVESFTYSVKNTLGFLHGETDETLAQMAEHPLEFAGNVLMPVGMLRSLGASAAAMHQGGKAARLGRAATAATELGVAPDQVRIRPSGAEKAFRAIEKTANALSDPEPTKAALRAGVKRLANLSPLIDDALKQVDALVEGHVGPWIESARISKAVREHRRVTEETAYSWRRKIKLETDVVFGALKPDERAHFYRYITGLEPLPETPRVQLRDAYDWWANHSAQWQLAWMEAHRLNPETAWIRRYQPLRIKKHGFGGEEGEAALQERRSKEAFRGINREPLRVMASQNRVDRLLRYFQTGETDDTPQPPPKAAQRPAIQFDWEAKLPLSEGARWWRDQTYNATRLAGGKVTLREAHYNAAALDPIAGEIAKELGVDIREWYAKSMYGAVAGWADLGDGSGRVLRQEKALPAESYYSRLRKTIENAPELAQSWTAGGGGKAKGLVHLFGKTGELSKGSFPFSRAELVFSGMDDWLHSRARGEALLPGIQKELRARYDELVNGGHPPGEAASLVNISLKRAERGPGGTSGLGTESWEDVWGPATDTERRRPARPEPAPQATGGAIQRYLREQQLDLGVSPWQPLFLDDAGKLHGGPDPLTRSDLLFYMDRYPMTLRDMVKAGALDDNASMSASAYMEIKAAEAAVLEAWAAPPGVITGDLPFATPADIQDARWVVNDLNERLVHRGAPEPLGDDIRSAMTKTLSSYVAAVRGGASRANPSSWAGVVRQALEPIDEAARRAERIGLEVAGAGPDELSARLVELGGSISRYVRLQAETPHPAAISERGVLGLDPFATSAQYTTSGGSGYLLRMTRFVRDASAAQDRLLALKQAMGIAEEWGDPWEPGKTADLLKKGFEPEEVARLLQAYDRSLPSHSGHWSGYGSDVFQHERSTIKYSRDGRPTYLIEEIQYDPAERILRYRQGQKPAPGASLTPEQEKDHPSRRWTRDAAKHVDRVQKAMDEGEDLYDMAYGDDTDTAEHMPWVAERGTPGVDLQVSRAIRFAATNGIGRLAILPGVVQAMRNNHMTKAATQIKFSRLPMEKGVQRVRFLSPAYIESNSRTSADYTFDQLVRAIEHPLDPRHGPMPSDPAGLDRVNEFTRRTRSAWAQNALDRFERRMRRSHGENWLDGASELDLAAINSTISNDLFSSPPERLEALLNNRSPGTLAALRSGDPQPGTVAADLFDDYKRLKAEAEEWEQLSWVGLAGRPHAKKLAEEIWAAAMASPEITAPQPRDMSGWSVFDFPQPVGFGGTGVKISYDVNNQKQILSRVKSMLRQAGYKNEERLNGLEWKIVEVDLEVPGKAVYEAASASRPGTPREPRDWLPADLNPAEAQAMLDHWSPWLEEEGTQWWPALEQYWKALAQGEDADAAGSVLVDRVHFPIAAGALRPLAGQRPRSTAPPPSAPGGPRPRLNPKSAPHRWLRVPALDLSLDEMRLLAGPTPLLKRTPTGVKGAVEQLGDGRWALRALKATDVATLFHETAHIIRNNLSPKLLAHLEKVRGVKDGIWSVPDEEWFARSYERWFYDGRAPSPQMFEVFQQASEWFGRIYKGGFGLSDVGLSPSLRKFFHTLMGFDSDPNVMVRQPYPVDMLSGYQRLGAEIKGRRERLGMTEDEAAVRAGISVERVRAIEGEQGTKASRKEKKGLALALRLDPKSTVKYQPTPAPKAMTKTYGTGKDYWRGPDESYADYVDRLERERLAAGQSTAGIPPRPPGAVEGPRPGTLDLPQQDWQDAFDSPAVAQPMPRERLDLRQRAYQLAESEGDLAAYSNVTRPMLDRIFRGEIAEQAPGYQRVLRVIEELERERDDTGGGAGPVLFQKHQKTMADELVPGSALHMLADRTQQLAEDMMKQGRDAPMYFPFIRRVTPSDFLPTQLDNTKRNKPKSLRLSTGATFHSDAFVKDPRTVAFKHYIEITKYLQTEELIQRFMDDPKVPKKLYKGQPLDPGEELFAPDGFIQLYRRAIDFGDDIVEYLDRFGMGDDAAAQAIRDAAVRGDFSATAAGVARAKVYVVPKAAMKELRAQWTPVPKWIRLLVDRPTDWWVTATLAFRPAWTLNNIVGGVMFSLLGGTKAWDYVRAALPEFIAKTPEEAGGGLAASFASQVGQYTHLGRHADSILGQMISYLEETPPARGVGRVADHITAFNAGVDAYFRRANFIHHAAKEARVKYIRRTGDAFFKAYSLLDEMDTMTPDEVTKVVSATNRFMGQFLMMHPWERQWFRRVVRFYSFMKHQTLLMMGMPFHSPGRYTMLSNLTQVAAEMAEADAAPLPEYLQGKGLIDSGVSITAGDPPRALRVFVNSQGWNPFIMGYATGAEGLRDLSDLPRLIASQGGPLAQYGGSLLTERTSFGQPFTEPGTVEVNGRFYRDLNTLPGYSGRVKKVDHDAGVVEVEAPLPNPVESYLGSFPQTQLARRLINPNAGFTAEPFSAESPRAGGVTERTRLTELMRYFGASFVLVDTTQSRAMPVSRATLRSIIKKLAIQERARKGGK